MSESILRLRVESQEYDNKIKRAAEGIQQYAQKCREAGGTLSFLDDGVLEFVQSLGQMDTVAKGSRQQMRELSNALTTLTTTYRGLTEEEKSSPFGIELARGIDALTERAGEARDAMSDVEQSIKNASSDTRTFDQLAQGMSVATAGFQGLTGAGKLLGIEMGNDVEVIAKLQAAMAVTNSLTTIQTALQKQSALMQGLNAAKTSLAVVAQQAYAVATGEATVAQAAFNVAANANPYMLIITAAAAAATAIYAYCEATDDAEDKQKALNVQLENARTQMEGIKTDSDFNVAIAKAAGESENSIRKMRLEAARARLALADLTLDQVTASGSGATKEQIKQAQEASQAAWREVKKVLDEMTVAEVERLTKLKTGPEVVITPDHKTPTTKAPSAAKAIKEKSIDDIINEQFPDIAQAEREGQSYGEQLMQSILTGMANKIQDADTNMLKNLLQVVVTNGLDVDIPTNDLMERILGDGENIPDSYWDNLAKAINEKLAELNLDPIELNFGTGEVRSKKEEDHKSEDPMKTLHKGLNGVTSILSGIQQMGMKLPDGIQQTVSVIQGLVSVIEGVHTIISLFSTTSMAANTAALVANTAALTVNSTVNAVPLLANGGIVPHAANGYFIPRNSFSGDTTPIMANAGELVLNESQQGVLASRLSDIGGAGNIHVTGHLEGENIALSVDRWGKRTGKGELAFFKNQ